MNAKAGVSTALWQSAFALFERLSTLGEPECARELEDLERHEPEVYPHVATLIRAHRDAQQGGFLAAIAPDTLGETANLPAELEVGSQLGAYRLERNIGSGGMGEVWLARRADGLFEAPVALKLLHQHLASSMVRGRFVREGKILGQLSHPNIARLLDAGSVTVSLADQRLYLAIEYVEGERLDRWCDAGRLDIAARLRLFCQVCEAVAHAHARLVVHRDLKPSNILVSVNGEVKLLDFGIAKLIEHEAFSTASTELTRLGGRALTPEYAAPEQILGAPITVATDVYALGVLLYVVLSGRRPYAREGGSPSQIEREALERDPVPPSQIRGLANEPPDEDIAALRSADTAHLRARLRGDLDTIVLKALKKAPAERYASVTALAEDLRRHLDHQPVLAQPDTLAYRAGKYLRRNRTGVLAAAAVLLALIAGFGVALWQAQVARVEARNALSEAGKVTAVKDFLIDIFQSNRAGEAGSGAARNITAEQLLARGAQRIRERLGEAPEVRAELLGTIGRLYKDLLLDETAIDLLREQVALLRLDSSDEGPPRLAEALANLGAALSNSGDYAGSDTVVQEALQIFDSRGDTHSLGRATALATLGLNAYWTLPSVDDTARRHYAAALVIVEQHHPLDPLRLSTLMGLANVADSLGKLALAEQHLRSGLNAAHAPGFKGVTSDIAIARLSLGTVLRRSRQLGAAELELRAALALLADSLGSHSSWIPLARQALALVLADSGQRDEAQHLLQEALAGARAVSSEQEDDVAPQIALDLGWLLYQRGLPDAAARHLEPLLHRYAGIDGYLLPTLTRLARIRLAQARPDEARSLLDQARPIVLRDRGETSRSYINLLLIEAELALDQQRLEVAGSLLDKADKALSPGESADLQNENLRLHWLRSRMALALGQHMPAASQMQALLDRIQSSPEADRLIDEEAQTQLLLGQALSQQGRRDEAHAPLQRAVELRARLDDPGSLWLARARLELARVQAQQDSE